MVTIVSS